MLSALIMIMLSLTVCPVNALVRIVPDRYNTIQAAVDAAQDQDTVLVRPGTYYENFVIAEKIIVVGSLFLTTGDEAYIDSTMIDGEEAESVVTIRNVENEAAVIAGFTITNGDAEFGGGVFMENSSPTLEYCIIRDNHAYNSGGGMICRDESYPIISHCTIDHNEVNIGGGGGVYCENSGPLFEYCVITRNHSDVEGGGGIHNHNGDSVLINCTISENWADGSGGAVFCTGVAEFHVVNCIFWNNRLYEISLYDNNQITVSYSDVEGGEERVVAYGESAAAWGIGNIDDDPRFVDPENGDFHLQITSPCIDAGDPDYPYDPDTTIADIGALFFDQSPVIVVRPDVVGFHPFVRTVDTARVEICNAGLKTLRIISREIAPLNPPDVTPFIIQNDDEELFLETDENHFTLITFEPPHAGDFEGEIRIVSNDPQNQLVSIPIVGMALDAAADEPPTPDDFGIVDVAPNPFNSSARITFTLPAPDEITLKLFDVRGAEVLVLVEGYVPAGKQVISIEAEDVPAGLYLAQLLGHAGIEYIKLIVIK